MQLTQEQKETVATWVAAGAKLSEVQQRLSDEFGVRLTYMEARFLIDDLQLVLAEKEKPKEEKTDTPADPLADGALAPEPQAGGGKVSISLDKIVRPGALVSGKVTFSDGVSAEWYLDQMGRFGLVPPSPTYRPSPDDMADFKIALEQELARQGL